MGITNGIFSAATFAEYANKAANKKESDTNKAIKTFVEKTVKDLGYPNKDEAHDIIQGYDKYDITPIADVIPDMVSGYIYDTERSFNLPAPNDYSSPAKIGIRYVDKKENTGTIMFGEHKGESYKSVTESHNEFFVKNFTKAFKK